VATWRILPALALCLAAAPGCSPLLRLIGRPRVQGVHPRISGIDFEGVNLDFGVDVRNPYPVRLKAPLLRYALEVEGKEFLRCDTPTTVDLPPRGTGTVAVPVRLSYSKLWSTYRSLRDLPEASYRFRGTLLLTALGCSFEVPFSREGKVPVLHAPRFSDVRLRVSELSLRRATVTVEAEVSNPNVFPVDIRGLGYVLKVGDAELGGLTASTAGLIPPGGTGHVTLAAQVSPSSVILRVLQGQSLRHARLCPSGSLLTPHGTVKLEP
jgi:LEA14-like dessication related protein